jgi:hypothetical protein
MGWPPGDGHRLLGRDDGERGAIAEQLAEVDLVLDEVGAPGDDVRYRRALRRAALDVHAPSLAGGDTRPQLRHGSP